MKFSVLVASLGVCCTLVYGDAVAERFYKWTDAKGVVQYTSTPPPKDAALAKEVAVSRAATPVSPVSSDVPVAVDGIPAAGQNAEITAENARRTQEYKQKMCAYARQQLSESQQRGPRRVVETRGSERAVALPAQRSAETAKWEAEAGKHCN
jgi:hypothetical protein